MNKIIYLIFFLFSALIIGFVAGFFLEGGVNACTEMYCECMEQGEVECNTCSHEDPIFALGLINVIKICNSKEILICEQNQRTKTRYEKQENCKTEVRWMEFMLNYRE